MSRVARLAFATALAGAAGPASRAWAQPAAPAAPPTVEYVVKPGDTCVGIAVRILGDRTAYEEIHHLNPGLGRLPHILAPGRVLRLPRKRPPAPAWAADAGATGFPSVAGAGASMRTAWSPVAGASAYRLTIDAASGVTVFSVEVPATVTHVDVQGAAPGRYRARVATIDAERFEGRPTPELELLVVDVAVSTPGGATAAVAPSDGDRVLAAADATPAAFPRVALGSVIGDGAVTCTATGASSMPLVVATPGPTTVACTTAEGRSVAPFGVDVVPVKATTPTGAGSVAVTRGSHEEIAITLASDVALGNGWRVEPGPGLTCEGFESVEYGVTIRVGVDGGAPATSTLDVIDDRTGSRIATLPVIIGDPVPEPDVRRPDITRPTRPRRAAPGRTQIAAGAFAGWTAFPSGMRDGLELGDAPVSAYQVDSGAGAGMRAAYWLQADLFVELEAGLWPTGFVAADEPAWITSGHALLGYQIVDRGQLAARAVVGAGGYALLGDATYARADVDPAVSWGLTGALRLNRELSVRIDGRHRIAPDRADAGATDVFEASIGIEAVLTRTPAPR